VNSLAYDLQYYSEDDRDVIKAKAMFYGGEVHFTSRHDTPCLFLAGFTNKEGFYAAQKRIEEYMDWVEASPVDKALVKAVLATVQEELPSMELVGTR